MTLIPVDENGNEVNVTVDVYVGVFAERYDAPNLILQLNGKQYCITPLAEKLAEGL